MILIHRHSLQQAKRERFFAMDGTTEEYVNNMREPINKVGLVIKITCFRASDKFFPKYLLNILVLNGSQQI